MRYREGETPSDLGPPVSDEMLLGTAVYGLILGLGFFIFAIRARQLWLAFWGGGLFVASVAYLGAMALGVA